MLDSLGRNIDHLRISLTNKCNLNCFYCHHEGNSPDMDADSEMSTEKVKRILNEAQSVGIRSIKFTGGEPMLRDDLSDIIKYTLSLGLECGLTTNGTLIKECSDELYSAGLRRVNIGCDSLTGLLPKNILILKENILHAKKAGFEIKINMVAMKMNKHEVSGMIDFCKENGIHLQLIELIDPNHPEFFSLDVFSALLEEDSVKVEIRDMQRRKRFFMNNIFIELVRPDRDFCSACNKLRVTADGSLKPCLMKEQALKFENADSIKQAAMARDSYGYN